jgi:hypothetical protein
MLELCKKVLLKVSFDAKLFKKELLKAVRWLKNKEDLQKLKIWCEEKFSSKYPHILAQVF